MRSLSARRKAETGSTLRRALEDFIEDLVNDSVSNFACVVASSIDDRLKIHLVEIRL